MARNMGEDSDKTSDRSHSANSRKGGAKAEELKLDELEDEDGIEVIYDVDYNGGGV